MFIQFTRNLTIDIPAFTAFTCNVVSSDSALNLFSLLFSSLSSSLSPLFESDQTQLVHCCETTDSSVRTEKKKTKSNEIDRWDNEKNCSLSLRNECFLTLLLLLLLQLEWIEYWLWNGWRRGQVFGDWLKSILIGDVRQRIDCSIGRCVTETAGLCKYIALLLFTGLCTIGQKSWHHRTLVETRNLLPNAVSRFETERNW